jgi:predicted transposase/invertase (TIGR01784 family)
MTTKDPNAGTPEVPTADEVVHSPHDRLFNRTMQQGDARRSLMELHFPTELMEHLKIETLVPADTSFIDPQLKRRFTDRLFTVEVEDSVAEQLGMRTKYVYLLVLIDHKSTDDPFTVIQMLGYMVRIWESAIENRRPLAPKSSLGWSITALVLGDHQRVSQS